MLVWVCVCVCVCVVYSMCHSPGAAVCGVLWGWWRELHHTGSWPPCRCPWARPHGPWAAALSVRQGREFLPPAHRTELPSSAHQPWTTLLLATITKNIKKHYEIHNCTNNHSIAVTTLLFHRLLCHIVRFSNWYHRVHDDSSLWNVSDFTAVTQPSGI